MKHFLLQHNRRAALCTRSLERSLRLHARTNRILSWLLSATLLAGLCFLFAYILAEAAFGSGSIVQFPVK